MNIRSGSLPAGGSIARSLLLLSLLYGGSAGWANGTETVAQSAFDPAVPAVTGEPGDGTEKREPVVEKLGENRYRVGAITVDTLARVLTVPGQMLAYDENKPIEFVATMRQGYKAYESILMLDVDAFEFNLACILIGLKADEARAAEYHFDPAPLEGDRVSIRITWQENGRRIEKNVIDLVKVGEKKPASPAVWIYTGSMFIEDNRYLAQMDGVLIGLIHDPASIIEHREGVGIGDWGSIAIDARQAPAGGEKILLTIRNLAR